MWTNSKYLMALLALGDVGVGVALCMEGKWWLASTFFAWGLSYIGLMMI